MVGVSGFEPEAGQALLEANVPTRSPLRGNRSGMTPKRPRVLINTSNKKMEPAKVDSIFLVGVSGFEPEASWTRTKRDTNLRHTPSAYVLYWNFERLSSLAKRYFITCILVKLFGRDYDELSGGI